MQTQLDSMSDNSSKNVCHESVYEQLFRAHSKDLHDFLYYKYGASNNPGDVVQEAFIKLWKNCAKVPFEKARGFLFTVANNKMLNELSKQKTALKFQKEPQKISTSVTPEFQLEEKQFEEKLEWALAQLSEAQRVAFMLNRVEGKKHKEIAELLDISTKAVEKRIYGALAKLKQLIQEKI